MTLTVRIPSPLQSCCGGAAELELPASSKTATLSVRAALAQLEQRYPELHRAVCDETGAVRRHVNLFVNRAHMRELQGLDTPLVSGDILTILPAVSGG
ncbi:MAG: MoaD/ThiS family protein [Planctomycetota bacterium]